MKLLEIKNMQGLFLDEKNDLITVDKITKDHLLRLVDLTLSEQDIEFDEYDEALIGNQAHQIVYQNIYQKLSNLYARRQDFVDETATQFLDDYNRYKQHVDDNEEGD